MAPKKQLNKLDLTSLYEKAQEHYERCIAAVENRFLSKEVTVPLESIVLKRANVKIVYRQEICENYQLEVCLELFDENNNSVGKYTYVEDEQGRAVDDHLVFY
ncbi:MAG TPA: hypothetical protein VEY71_08265 [Chitinophagales bacterium]|nr:hypothetical protein [Chitinophagales bacterium]